MTADTEPARVTITGTLIADSPVHVGAHDGLEVDRPFIVDGAGRWILPGTSLAGVLRSAVPRPAGQPRWWGDASHDGVGASAITVDDAIGPAPATAGPASTAAALPWAGEMRWHVGIDGRWGIARPGVLYTIESVPAGTAFAFHCTIDLDLDATPVDDGGDVPMPAVARDLVDAMIRGIAVGGRRGSGQGRVRLVDHHVSLRRRHNRADLRSLVTSLQTSTDTIWHGHRLVTGRLGANNSAAPAVDVRMRIQASGPLLIADRSLGDALDILPLTTTRGDRVHLVIPGSSIRGVLRAHATRITNTLLGRPLTDPDDFEAPAAALISELFGSTHHQGAVTVGDVLSRPNWPRQAWEDLRRCDKDTRRPTPKQVPPAKQATDRRARGRSAAPAQPPEQEPFAFATRNQRLRVLNDVVHGVGDDRRRLLIVGDHVAIDRWTGGARDGALYNVLEPWLTGADDWEPLRIQLRWRPGPEPSFRQRAARCLLTLVMRDLAAGRLGIGFGTTKGYGHVVSPDIPTLDDDDASAWRAWWATGHGPGATDQHSDPQTHADEEDS